MLCAAPWQSFDVPFLGEISATDPACFAPGRSYRACPPCVGFPHPETWFYATVEREFDGIISTCDMGLPNPPQ